MSRANVGAVLGSLQETFYNNELSKRFYSPSKIHWGVGMFDLVVNALQGTAAVIFYDRAFSSGKHLDSLRQACAPGTSLFSVETPPSPEAIARIVAQLGSVPSVVVALGGGSTLDTAKCVIAHYLFGSIDGIGMGARRGELPCPTLEKPLLIALPSTAGTGAESSRYFVTYSEGSLAKIHGKSWSLVADWTFLDPEIALCAPKRVIYESALDAFVHSTESFLCMKESSWVNTSLCLGALGELRRGLDSLRNGTDPMSAMLSLQSSSSIAGVAISNVRTGHVHEMAGALLEHTGLSHPQTLSVFLREGLTCMQGSPAGALKLKALSEAFGHGKLQETLEYWELLLEEGGTLEIVRARLSHLSKEAWSGVRSHVLQRCTRDGVWANKECPLRMDEHILAEVFERSVAPFIRT